MAYSSYYVKKGNRYLSVLGVIAFLSLIVGGMMFVRQMGREHGWQTTKGIERLSIVNISSHGFEVVWSTKEPVTEDQWIEWGTQKNVYSGKQGVEYMNGVYYVDIKGLAANTTYYYRVRKGTKTYELDALVPTLVKTPQESKEKPISPAYGKVVLPSGKPYANGLLIYDVDGYYPLAVFTKETGEWLMPLTGLVDKKTNSIRPLTESTSVSLKLFSYPDGNVRTTVGQTRPLRQAITAGISLRMAQVSTEPGSVLGDTTGESSLQAKGQSRIIYPKENAIIPGNAPLIRGTAAPSRDVLILIQGPAKQYSYRTKADEKGDWLVKYPVTLEAGRYTIAATMADLSGFPLTIRRVFSIIKSGEQVLGTATGTPTLIPTAPIIPTSVLPSASPTLIPTIALSPTTIIPTRFVPTVTPPVSGGGIPEYLFMAFFFIVVGAGLVLAF